MLEQLPPDLARRDADSRARWSVAAYKTLSDQLPDDALLLLIGAGREKFLRDARAAYAPQMFREDDFERIWRLLSRRAEGIERRRAAGIVTIHG